MSMIYQISHLWSFSTCSFLSIIQITARALVILSFFLRNIPPTPLFYSFLLTDKPRNFQPPSGGLSKTFLPIFLERPEGEATMGMRPTSLGTSGLEQVIQSPWVAMSSVKGNTCLLVGMPWEDILYKMPKHGAWQATALQRWWQWSEPSRGAAHHSVTQSGPITVLFLAVIWNVWTPSQSPVMTSLCGRRHTYPLLQNFFLGCFKILHHLFWSSSF